MSILNGRPLEYVVDMGPNCRLVAGGETDPLLLVMRCLKDDPIWQRPNFYGTKPRFRLAKHTPKTAFGIWAEKP